MDRSDEDRAINEVIDRLAKQFPRVPADEVAQVVSQSRPEFEDAPIRDFVPLFVGREAKAKLRELAPEGLHAS
jgi:hypothetical protein